MINSNKIYNVGDSILVNVRPEMSGKITLQDYQDNLNNLTPDRNVTKEFRVSIDDIFWTQWNELNSSNLSERVFTSDGRFTIQIRYTRIGQDTSGFVEFINIDFLGSRENIEFVAPTIDSSIFSGIINTPEFRKLEINLFKKLYYRGIVPNYLDRAENSDDIDDRDYIDLFFSVARFFSLIIRFFKRFENFNDDFDLLREYVRQNGLYFDESTITLEELQYLSQHFYDEIRKRGTDMIFKRKGDIMPDGSVAQIDGEFIRLLRSKIGDELLYEYIPLHKTGWCMEQSSPLYRGTARSFKLNKTPDNTEDFSDISKYFLSSTNSSNFVLLEEDGKRIVRLSSSDNQSSTGFGRVNDSFTFGVKEKLFKVDSAMDYEITFRIKANSVLSLGGNLFFGVEGFDQLKNKLNDSFIVPNGDSVSERFFDTAISMFKRGEWYYVRGIIHSYSTMNIYNYPKTNIGVGNNLHFNNRFTKYILPKILLTGGTSVQIDIWDYKIRPLVRGTNILPLKNGSENSHSLGFIQSSRIFYAYVRNNNNSQTKEQITDIIEKYLLNYNTTDILVFMSNF